MTQWYEYKTIDMRIEIEIPAYIWPQCDPPNLWKELGKTLTHEIKQFREFIDDDYQLNVVTKQEVVCKHCGHSYGEMEDVNFWPNCCDAAMQEVGYMVVDYAQDNVA